MDPNELKSWLAERNSEYRREDVPPKARPFKALADLSIKLRTSIYLGSDLANTVFIWFEENSKADAHFIGALFEGAYFYDATFWRLVIPVFYGTVKLNGLDLARDMPDAIKESLKRDVKEFWEFASCVADTTDYAVGFEEIHARKGESELLLQLLRNADAQLRSCTAGLLAQRPNRSVIQAGRLATEIFMKAILCKKGNASAASIKKLGHDLGKILNAAFTATKSQDLKRLEPYLSVYPEIGNRYTGTEEEPRFLWHCYRVALAVGSTVIRLLTGRDTRPQLGLQH